MSKKILPVAAALIVIWVSLAQMAGAAGPDGRPDLSLDSDTFNTGDVLQISYSLFTDYPGLSLDIRRLVDGAVIAAFPGIDNSSGIYRQAWDSTGIPEGQYYVRLYGTTAAGREDERTASFTLDNSPPDTAVSSPDGLNGWYLGPVMLNATDHLSGVASITYRVDGGVLSQQAGNHSEVKLLEGTHMLSFQAADRAGNFEPQTTVRVKVDTTPPEIKYQLSGDTAPDGRFTSAVNVTLEAGDAISGIDRTKYSPDGERWTDYAGTFTVPFGSDCTIYFRTTDRAGHATGGDVAINFQPTAASPGVSSGTVTPVPENVVITPSPSATATAASAVPLNTTPAAAGITPQNGAAWTMLGMALVSIAVMIIAASAVYLFVFKGRV